MRWLHLALLVGLLGAATATAQSRASSSENKPAFVPGLYLVETRNSATSTQGTRSERCLRAADYDAFRREILAAFRARPQFRAACRLSAPTLSADGFSVAMDCGAARSIIAYRFEAGLVRATTETRIVNRPENSTTELSLMRRIDACREP